MNSGGWYIFLFLFILGVTCQGINETGIWSVYVSEPNGQFTAPTQDQFNATQDAALKSPLGIFVIYDWIMTFMKILFSGVIAVFSIPLMLHGIGFSPGIIVDAMIQMIQLPAQIIMFFWLFELWTGH